MPIRDQSIYQCEKDSSAERAEIRAPEGNSQKNERNRLIALQEATKKDHEACMEEITREAEKRIESTVEQCAEKTRAARTTFESKVADYMEAKEKALRELSARNGSAYMGRQMAKERINGPNASAVPARDRFEGRPPSEYMHEEYAGQKRKREGGQIEAEVRKCQ